jgi:iron complex outermembrane receptor protein
LTCDPSTNAACRGNGGIDAFNYLDVSASFVVGQLGEFTVGVNNVADKEPPMTGVTLALNGNAPGGYDAAGRYFFTNFNFSF